MCLEITDIEEAQINNKFIVKLSSLGYPIDMCEGQIIQTYYHQGPRSCKFTFKYFLLRYEVLVEKHEDYDDEFWVYERIYDLDDTINRLLRTSRYNDPVYREIDWDAKYSGSSSRDEILDHVLSYTPEYDYFDYIEILHERLRWENIWTPL